MRKLFIIFLSIGLILALTSCEKQQVEAEDLRMAPAIPQLEEADLAIEKATPDFSKENLVQTEEIVFDRTKSSDRSSTFGYGYNEVYQSSYTLGTGQWVNLQIDKRQLVSNYRYVAVLTPVYGDPDVYVKSYYYDHYGHVRATNRRASKRRGHYLDESWMYHNDVNSHETHGSFYLHSSYSCNFKLSIYEVPAHTVWIRHASTHYGRRNISVRYNHRTYEVKPGTAVAMDYNHSSPSFDIWECTSRPGHYNQYCGWKRGNTANKNDYMYSLSDSNDSGNIGFTATQQGWD